MKSLLRANPELEKFRPHDFTSEEDAQPGLEEPRAWKQGGEDEKRARGEERGHWRRDGQERAAEAVGDDIAASLASHMTAGRSARAERR
eukprot:765995-Hanusia_phi.AAC.3